MQRIKLLNSANKYIYGNCWKVTDGESKGNIIISHGMCEYSARYDEFAEFLVSQGYDVYAVDHPGHGLNVSVPDNPEYGLGVWPHNGFKLCVDYLHDLITEVRLTMKPIILFAHSMGSIVAQRYIQRYSDTVDGVILCGTTYRAFEYTFARHFLNLLSKFKNEYQKESQCKFINNIQLSTFNRGIKPYEDKYVTKNGWLSFNEDNVKQFDLDPMCGFVPSFNFYLNLFGGMKPTFEHKRLKSVRKDLPILLIAGKKDPVGHKTKSITKLAKTYNKYGINATTIYYDNARHEILNEACKEQVFKDCLNFITKTFNNENAAK